MPPARGVGRLQAQSAIGSLFALEAGTGMSTEPPMEKCNVRRAILGVFLGVGSPYACAAPDWSQIPKRDIQVFHPGVATHEWVMMKSSHSGRTGLTKGESCVACHEGKTGLDIDLKKLAAKDLEPVGAPGTMIFPVSVQAAFDDANLHIRLTFKAPADAAPSASREEVSPRHDVKVAIMFAGAQVEQSVQQGCWTSCHSDVRSMPGADPKKKKYIEHGELAGGVFYDYIHSGRAAKPARVPRRSMATSAANG